MVKNIVILDLILVSFFFVFTKLKIYHMAVMGTVGYQCNGWNSVRRTGITVIRKKYLLRTHFPGGGVFIAKCLAENDKVITKWVNLGIFTFSSS